MASRSCSSSLLSVLIILLALKYSSANCCEGNIGTKRKWPRGSNTGKHVSLQSDAKFLGGRKMLQGLDEKPLYISGKYRPADLERSFPEPQTESDRINAQNNGEMFKQKGNHKSEGSRVPSGVDEHQRSQNSMPHDSADLQATTPTSSGNENVVAKDDHYITKKNDEAKAFLEAADEVANMMRKDYRGAPRRKPPINNHQPKD